MLLAVDVGNTTVNVGIFNNVGARHALPLQIKKIPTMKPASKRYYLAEFKKLLKNKPIDDIIISSVVPDTTKVLKAIFKANFNIKPIVLGKDLIVPIKNLYKNPKQVGQDRLVNAYAGYKKFVGGLIIIDFGTAVTFDCVSKKGEYIGGIIVPGLEISLEALSQKAALLGAVGDRALQKCRGRSPNGPKKAVALIGRDTFTSMLSGILHGFGALCDGLVAKIKKKMGADSKVILTGGYAKIISKYCHFDAIQPNLTLEGLNLIGIAEKV